MKQLKSLTLAAALLASYGAIADMTLSFSDPAWTGDSIPEAQMCQRFGGKDPQSPELNVAGVPSGADALVLYFSDKSFKGMDNGGHGTVGFKLEAGATSVTVPRIPGHTDALSGNLFVVAMHKAPNWDKAGAYLPPCSGGRGNKYAIEVKAVKLAEDNSVAEVLSEASIPLATY